MPGFPRLLLTLAEAFAEHRTEIDEQASEIADHLNRRGNMLSRVGPTSASALLSSLLVAETNLLEDSDERNGGFGRAPKFPNTMALELLLRIQLHRQSGELPDAQPARPGSAALDAVNMSLQKMAYGGIYDQLGGGFHRYSVDERWLVPHFEKMLYDNALLSRVYLHAYLVTDTRLYQRIAEETLDYVVREMTSPEGGFYSTQDADSEGEEGKFFVWTPDEVERVLDAQHAALFMRYYDVTARGNFEGKNILHIRVDPQSFAKQEHISVEDVQQILQQSRVALFQAREQRIKPGRDEKILTSWNGLMLRSFAEAARYLKRPDYLKVAIQNATFLLETLQQNGRVLRTYKDGRARLHGYLEDYAFLADGLLALYEASFDVRWFTAARTLMDQAMTLFSDEQQGGLLRYWFGS